MAEAGGDVIGVDWRISLTNAAKLVPDKPLQGNLDPAAMLTTPEIIEREAKRIIEEGRGLPGHIFNLGHGIYPEVPLENVARLALDAGGGTSTPKAIAIGVAAGAGAFLAILAILAATFND